MSSQTRDNISCVNSQLYKAFPTFQQAQERCHPHNQGSMASHNQAMTAPAHKQALMAPTASLQHRGHHGLSIGTSVAPTPHERHPVLSKGASHAAATNAPACVEGQAWHGICGRSRAAPACLKAATNMPHDRQRTKAACTPRDAAPPHTLPAGYKSNALYNTMQPQHHGMLSTAPHNRERRRAHPATGRAASASPHRDTHALQASL